MQNHVNDGCRHPSSDDIDGVMGLDIDRRHTQQHVDGQHTPEEVSVAQAPDEEHQDRRYAHMAAGKGCRGALTRIVGILHHVIEETVAPSGHRQTLLVGCEIIAYVREYTSGDAIDTYGLIVVLRACDGQEDEDDIVDEECREDDECRTVELLVAEEKGEQRHEGDHREIARIAQVHQFAEHGVGDGLREQQGRLKAEHRLVIAGKQMVAVGEDPVEFVGVCIPPRQE